MNDQHRIETAADNCEVLRARLARYEDGDGKPITTIAEQAREIERLRMQLVACGVVALANTPESAAKARDMHPDYMSASCGDVIRTVDIQMQLRAELAALKAQPDPWKASGADWCSSIHSNPDAMAWADFFVAVFPGQADKHELMFGWFANAMMAMHDHLKANPSGVVMPPHCTDRAIPVKYRKGWNCCISEVARLNSSPVSAGEPVYQFQCREIGEGDWEPCDHSRYMYCQKSPEMDTRVVQVQALSAPSHGERVRVVPVEPTEAMRKAAQDKLASEGLMVTDWLIHAAYSAMLAAAPSAGSHKEKGE